MQPSPRNNAQNKDKNETAKRVAVYANELHPNIGTYGNFKVSHFKNFKMRYKSAGTPKPKLYTKTTPYRTSSSLKIY